MGGVMERKGGIQGAARLGRGRKSLLRKLQGRRRAKEGRWVAEGPRVVEELLRSRLPVDFVVVSRDLGSSPAGARLLRRLEEVGVELVVADDGEMREVAGTEEPQGVLAVASEVDPALSEIQWEGAGGVLVLDRVQDPGNVGTLVRTAWALGVHAVVALDGTSDPWSAKALRSSAGGAFHLPVARASVDELLTWLASAGIQLLAADSSGGPPPEESVPARWALVVGNEGSGVRPRLLNAAAHRVQLPMPGGAESLNASVAGSILLYLLSRPHHPIGSSGWESPWADPGAGSSVERDQERES